MNTNSSKCVYIWDVFVMYIKVKLMLLKFIKLDHSPVLAVICAVGSQLSAIHVSAEQ